MTVDLSTLSREEFADYLCGCRTCDAGNMVCEAARRLRADAGLADRLAKAEAELVELRDEVERMEVEHSALVLKGSADRHDLAKTIGSQRAELHALNVAIRERDRLTDARIAELERNRDEGMTMLQARNERIPELEAQLAANSKGEVPIAIGDRVRYKSCNGHSGIGEVDDVGLAMDGYPYRILLEGGGAEWMNDDEIVERLPPEPAKPVENEKFQRTMAGMHEARSALQRECDGLRAERDARNIAYALGLAAAYALGIAAGADAAFDYGNDNNKALLKRVGYWG